MKKLITILFSIGIILGVGAPAAFAAVDQDVQIALELIEKTNTEIDNEIEKAVNKADELHAKYLLDIQKNEEEREKIEKITEKYSKDLDKIITNVYDKTLKMSTKTIEKAAELGVQAECSWRLVRFADQWVWIDPIRVVGW